MGGRRLTVALNLYISIIFHLGEGKSSLLDVYACNLSMPGDRGRKIRSCVMSPCIMQDVASENNNNNKANKPNKEHYVNFNHPALIKFTLIFCGLFKNVTHFFNGFKVYLHLVISLI